MQIGKMGKRLAVFGGVAYTNAYLKNVLGKEEYSNAEFGYEIGSAGASEKI